MTLVYYSKKGSLWFGLNWYKLYNKMLSSWSLKRVMSALLVGTMLVRKLILNIMNIP